MTQNTKRRWSRARRTAAWRVGSCGASEKTPSVRMRSSWLAGVTRPILLPSSAASIIPTAVRNSWRRSGVVTLKLSRRLWTINSFLKLNCSESYLWKCKKQKFDIYFGSIYIKFGFCLKINTCTREVRECLKSKRDNMAEPISVVQGSPSPCTTSTDSPKL